MKPHDSEALSRAAAAVVRLAYFQATGKMSFAPDALDEGWIQLAGDMAEALTGYRDLPKAFEVVRVKGPQTREDPPSRPRKQRRRRTPPPPAKPRQRPAAGFFE